MDYDTKTGGFKSLGEFLVRARAVSIGQASDSRLVKTGHLAMSDDSLGGFLIPEEWASQIMAVALEDAIVRPRAVVLKAHTDSLHVRTIVESDRSTYIYGGVTFTWMAPATAISGASVISGIKFGDVEMTPHKLGGGFFTANELMADVDNFGNLMRTFIGRALAFVEDAAFIRGSGAGQPLGILNCPALIKTVRAAGTSTDIYYEDLAGVAARFLPDSWKRAVWLVSPGALASLIKLKRSDTALANHIDMGQNTILGRPFIVTEQATALGTFGDLILADFAHYLIADRSIIIDASQHVPGSYGYVTDETFWRITFRVDGQPMLSSAITPKNGSTTVSPFVTIATHS